MLDPTMGFIGAVPRVTLRHRRSFFLARRLGRSSVVALIVTILALLSVSTAHAAAPNYIFISGPDITRPILLADWRQNQNLFTSLAMAPFAPHAVAGRLAGRPRFDVAEFWGWTPPSPRPRHPSQANQHGWFYPRYRGAPAVFLMMISGTTRARLAPRSALAILARHHVPVTQ